MDLLFFDLYFMIGETKTFVETQVSTNSASLKTILNEVKDSYKEHFGKYLINEYDLKNQEFVDKIKTYNGKILMKILFAFKDDENLEIQFKDSAEKFNYKLLASEHYSMERTFLFETYKDTVNFLNYYLGEERSSRDSNNFIIFVEWTCVFRAFYKLLNEQLED